MSTTRFFTGTRASGQLGEAAKLKKLELLKGGPLPITQAERYSMILKKKLQESQSKAAQNPRNSFSLPGAKPAEKQMSKKAEQALKEVAKRKAIKEEKAMRQMVAIMPRNYYDSQGYFGRLDAKGNMYDEEGNVVLRVNGKKGIVQTNNGTRLGKYKPKSAMHVSWMRDWVTKNSPYHIKLKQLENQKMIQAMYDLQNGTAANAVNLLGQPVQPQQMQGQPQNSIWGSDDFTNGRNNMGVTAWGVMSNNVHGTYAENVWGGFADNVWGRASANVWGGIGDAPAAWGKVNFKIWGSGRPGQKNHLKAGLSILGAMLGFGRRNNYRRRTNGSGSGRSGGSAPRSGGGGRR